VNKAHEKMALFSVADYYNPDTNPQPNQAKKIYCKHLDYPYNGQTLGKSNK